ncbi:MAG: DUF429 domain-containing protein [Burkholderiaceae bacterium]
MSDARARDLAGIDFTSRPSRGKPITVAHGRLSNVDLTVDRIDEHADFDSYTRWLNRPDRWLAAFDFPFGLPRELVEQLGWPTAWPELMRHYASLTRAEVRDTFAAFCAARPVGAKFAHRATDGPAGSSPSMKWVNPPVAYMLHAGVPLLIAAGIHLPGLHTGDPARVALEGYPGLLARELLGARSYKSDAPAKQTAQRRRARIDLIDALRAGRSRLGIRLCVSDVQREALIADASADRLDAVLCLMQAAWASTRPNHGLPTDIDAIEGWIVSAG